jgi:polygalacturonase
MRKKDQTVRRDFLKLAGAGMAGLSFSTATSLAAQSPQRPHANGVLNVKDFGAIGDDRTLDTAAINKAIETANANGGGTVYVPPGVYLCYSIRLKSNVALYLDQGATIVGADTPMDGFPAGSNKGYDEAEPGDPAAYLQDYGHNHWHNSLIWGDGLHDIAILGTGLIWGRGLSRGAYKDTPAAEKPGVGNKAIALKNCRNVTFKDFSMLKGGHFAILFTGVDNLTVDNLKIDTNRDGIDIDCCKNVRVSNCSVNSPWDDAICPKSSFALGYARITENVTITNCYVTGKYETGAMLDGTYKLLTNESAPTTKLFRNGRIKCGTESTGGFRNITVSNCVFEASRGFALQAMDGGLIEDIAITNITMREASNAPFYLRIGARMRGPAGRPIGTMRRVMISNLISHDAATLMASMIQGFPGHVVEDVKLSDIYCHQVGGGTKYEGIPPEVDPKLTEPSSFHDQPAHGLFVRYAKNLEATNIEFETAAPDARPAFWMQDVHGADFFRVRIPTDGAAFDLHRVSDFRVFSSRVVKDTESNAEVTTTL